MDTTNILLEPTPTVVKQTQCYYILWQLEKEDLLWHAKVKLLIRMSTVHVFATVSLYLLGEP